MKRINVIVFFVGLVAVWYFLTYMRKPTTTPSADTNSAPTNATVEAKPITVEGHVGSITFPTRK